MAEDCIVTSYAVIEVPIRAKKDALSFVFGASDRFALAPQTESRKFTYKQNKCVPPYKVDVYDNGLSKTPTENTQIGTLTYDENRKAVFITSPENENKYSNSYNKAIGDVQGKVLTSAIDNRKQILADKVKNGEDIVGITAMDPDEIKKEFVPSSLQLEHVAQKGFYNLDGTLEIRWPDSLSKLIYPKKLDEIGQDFVKINIIDYKPRLFTEERFKRYKRYEQYGKNILSTIFLPIQSGIVDNNSVSWNADPLNAIQQAAQFASLQIQTSGPDILYSQIPEIAKILQDPKLSENLRSAFSNVFARLALNSENNFMSRAFGAILNPNLELLFQNPELRSFNLRFDLTPRGPEEGKIVRQIIRAFKQSMAARQGVADMFLKTPMVYDIQYINGKTKSDHKSINRIKTCALKNFSVNYTPSNQYMTYDGGAQEMTSYSLEMQFTELEPIYYDDYAKDINGRPIGEDEIGY